jgi:hypothetical protein
MHSCIACGQVARSTSNWRFDADFISQEQIIGQPATIDDKSRLRLIIRAAR